MIVTVVRWLWAHRVPLIPVWVVLGVALATVGARAMLAGLPVWQVGAVMVLLFCPGLLYARRVLARWRRRWITTLTVVSIALPTWGYTVPLADTGQLRMLALAHVVLGVAVLAGTLLNLPLGERVSMEGELRGWPEIGKRIGYPETRWQNVTLTQGQGWTARLTWPAGTYQRAQVIKDVGRFEDARDLPDGSLKFKPVGRQRNCVDVVCTLTPPDTKPKDWPGPARDEGYSAKHPVSLGGRDDGTEVKIVRFKEGQGEQRILIGGASGSGKSGVINNLVGEDACRDDVVALGMDLKGGVELGPWAQVFLWMIHDIEGAMQMLAALEAGAVYRQGLMRERKVRVWPISPQLPVIHLTIDEIRRLAGSSSGRTGKQQRLILDRLVDVATQGRAVGIGCAFAGQRLTLEALGTSQISTQMDIRLGLRMNDKDSSNYVFPDDGVNLQRISSDLPGTAILKDGDKLDSEEHRGWFWSDELVAEIAELRAGGGAQLDEGTGDAMAAASPMFAEIWARVRGESPGNAAGNAAGNDPERRLPDGESPAGNAGNAAGNAAGNDPADGESPGGEGGESPGTEIPAVFAADDDLSLAEVVARNAARRAAEGRPAPTVLRPKEPRRLNGDQARAAVFEMLRRSGAAGATPRELYRSATRSSSWLHKFLTERIDDVGDVVRTPDGTYALVSARQEVNA